MANWVPEVTLSPWSFWWLLSYGGWDVTHLSACGLGCMPVVAVSCVHQNVNLIHWDSPLRSWLSRSKAWLGYIRWGFICSPAFFRRCLSGKNYREKPEAWFFEFPGSECMCGKESWCTQYCNMRTEQVLSCFVVTLDWWNSSRCTTAWSSAAFVLLEYVLVICKIEATLLVRVDYYLM